MLHGMATAGRVERFWLDTQERSLAWLSRTGAQPQQPRHLSIGIEGEQAAPFWLRRRGVVIVARRWTNPRLRGDVDLIGWDQTNSVHTLCFFEVKTRTARDLTPAESQVDDDKRHTLRSLARAYLRSFPPAERAGIPVRFDVVSVYLLGAAPEFDHFQGAFGWR